MAWTADDLARLDSAIALGARRVVYGEGGTRKEVEYHSKDEMLALRATMRAELGLAPTAGSRVTYAAFRKGWR